MIHAFLRLFFSALLGTTALWTIPAALAQQVPQVLGYQGRVAVGGVNFDGNGQFKFALVNATTGDVLWSNDGSLGNNVVPTAFVTLKVTKGLYSVQLGDTSLANMAAIPAGVFNNADVRLRVWFNDGTANGFQLLAPDQRLSSVAYAIAAGTAQTVVPGSVGTAQLANGLTLGGTITLAGGVNLPATSSASVGVILQGGSPLIHTFGGASDFFAGSGAGNFTMTGTSNTALGSAALQANTTGNGNTACGTTALYSNTAGISNTASGTLALFSNTTGSNNTANGAAALYSNTTGGSNTATGDSALRYNTTGVNNVASGVNALSANTTGNANVASGVGALLTNTTGSSNTAHGVDALRSNTTGNGNVATGASVLYFNTTGNDNTASGGAALYSNTGGNNNVAIGPSALYSNLTGIGNTASGTGALFANTTGNNNTALGPYAGNALTTGSNNIDIGNGGVAAEANTIRMGTAGTQTRAFIAGIRGVTTGQNNGVTVLIDSNGQLGTVSSSRRYKEDIADMGDASARLQALRPVTFHYRKPFENGDKPIQFGLIAEEVAEVFPELAVYNSEGEPETVKYQDLTPMLLNEVQKMQAAAGRQEEQLKSLGARVEELEGLLRKAHEEMSHGHRPIPGKNRQASRN